VLFKGEDQGSQVDIQNRPPENLADARKLAEPRVVPNRNIFRRSFVLIRQITGF
jgi:hypothetical protein